MSAEYREGYRIAASERDATITSLQAEVARLRKAMDTGLKKANERLPGVETPLMRGDNLAVCLCSFFDDGDKETEDDTGWSEAARRGYEEVIAAIRRHYTNTIRAALGGDDA